MLVLCERRIETLEIWQEVLISCFCGGGGAAIILALFIKDLARKVFNEEAKNYTTKTEMQKERQNLREDIERHFLSIVAFREFEKRIDENFKTVDRRLCDTTKRFDKLDSSLDHITDLIMEKVK